MNTSSEPPSINDRQQGLSASLRSVMLTALDYVEARMALLKAEAGEVTASAFRAAALLATALVASILFYFSIVAAFIIWVARTWWQGDLLPALLIAAGLHFIIALAAVLLSRRTFSTTRFFRHSIQEIQSDRLWLKTHPHTSQS